MIVTDFGLQAAFFVLIFIGYIIIFSSIVTSPSIVGYLFGKWRPSTSLQVSVDRWQLIGQGTLAIALSLALALTDVWKADAILVWRNPLLVLWFGAYAAIMADAKFSANPLLKLGGKVTRFLFLIVFVLVAGGLFWGHLIEESTLRWGLLSASFVGIVSLFASGMATRFVSSGPSETHDRVEQLRHMSSQVSLLLPFIGPRPELNSVREVIQHIQSCLVRVENEIGNLKYRDAQRTLIEADLSGNHLVGLLESPVVLQALHEEIQNRIERAKLDVEQLQHEFKQLNFQIDALEEHTIVLRRVGEQLAGLLGRSTFYEEIEQLQRVLHAIADLRTAARLRETADPLLQNIVERLNSIAINAQVYGSLGFDSTVLARKADDCRTLCSELENTEISPGVFLTYARDIVSLFNEIVKLDDVLRTEVQQKCHSTAGPVVSVGIPKTCRTDSTSTGIILVAPGDDHDVRIELDGTLIELQSTKNLSVRRQTGSYWIESFSFVGKRPGIGRIGVRLDIQGSSETKIFDIKVMPSLEQASLAGAAYGTPIGAVVGLGMHYFLRVDPQGAAFVGLALGSTVTFAIALLKRRGLLLSA